MKKAAESAIIGNIAAKSRRKARQPARVDTLSVRKSASTVVVDALFRKKSS